MRPSSSPSHRLLAIGVHEHGERRAVGADRRLDDVRQEALVVRLVEVLELLARVLLVPRRGRSRRDCGRPRSPGSRACHRSRTGCRTPRARSARARSVRADGSAAAPASSPSDWCHSMRCSFQYSNHSMSVPGSTKNCISICSNSRVRKMKLPGVISLRNALPICAMPNGTFCRVALLHVQEVHDRCPAPSPGAGRPTDALSSTGPMNVLNMRLNMPRLGERPWSAAPGHLRRLRGQLRVLELVGAKALLAGPAVDERIDEAGDVTARLPRPRMHEDRRVEPLDVVARAHHRRPPAVLEVLLQLDAERTVVPHRAGAAVDLGDLEDEAAPLAERHELFQDVGLGTGSHVRVDASDAKDAAECGACRTRVVRRRHRTASYSGIQLRAQLRRRAAPAGRAAARRSCRRESGRSR